MQMKLRHFCLAIGLLGSAGFMIGGDDLYSSQPLPFEEQAAELSILDMRDATVLPHYAKITSIIDELEGQGKDIPADLALDGLYFRRLVAIKRDAHSENEQISTLFDMMSSEGEIEAKAGDWTVDAVQFYADRVLSLDERFKTIADVAASFLEQNGVSEEKAAHYVKRSIGVACMEHLARVGFITVAATHLEQPTSLLDMDADIPDVVAGIDEQIRVFFADTLDALSNIDAEYNSSVFARHQMDAATEPYLVSAETPGVN